MIVVGWTADELRAKFSVELSLEPVRVYSANDLDGYLTGRILERQGVALNENVLPPGRTSLPDR